MITIVKDRSDVQRFLDNAGRSLETFRYFSRRSLDVLDNHVVTFLDMDNNEPIAYGHLDRDGKKVWLGICVSDKMCGRGLGKLMMKALIAAAIEHQIPSIWLAVDVDNTVARQLYEKIGFVRTLIPSTMHALYKYQIPGT